MEELKYLGPDTYKDSALSIKSQRMVFIIYHIMGLRNGDYMPDVDRLNAIAEEHGIHEMALEDMIGYERWLRQGEL